MFVICCLIVFNMNLFNKMFLSKVFNIWHYKKKHKNNLNNNGRKSPFMLIGQFKIFGVNLIFVKV